MLPPTTVHFNGGVNLADAETVMREIAARVPSGVRRVPDGETGDRQQWIFFQLARFQQTQGLEDAGTSEELPEDYGRVPNVRLAAGVDPESLVWPNLGYADAYRESFQVFQRLRTEGILPAAARFQVQYPTPLASVSAWLVPEDQDCVEASYEQALFADLDRLLAAIPHGDVAVQWDVAVEFGSLEYGIPGLRDLGLDAIVQRLARCVDQVPGDVPVGMHLCYGDFHHRHFKDPESLALQVQVVNALDAAASRPVSWYAFTVPQHQRSDAFFAPLRDLRAGQATELNFALVPYHPDTQEPGTTDDQVRLVDEYLARDEWGICTECGMARAEREEIPGLLDKYREIIAAYAG